MGVFKDSDFLDRMGTVIAGVAGVAGTAAGGVAVGGSLLAAAFSGKAALQGRLEAKSSDASHVIGEFIEQFRDNWEAWSEFSSKPEDLQSAALSFEEYFKAGDEHSVPSAELIIAEGLDAEKITRAMLVTASEHSPNVYSNTPINAFNRTFFTAVIQSALSHLIASPAFVDTLQPAFQKLVMKDLAGIKEGVDGISNKLDEQVLHWQTKEQYEKQLHTLELSLKEKETELRLNLINLGRSESRTDAQQEKYIEAKFELRSVESARRELENKLVDVESAYEASQKALTQALSQLPKNRLDQVRSKIAETPNAVPDEMVAISDELDAQSAAIKFEAANLYQDQIRYNEALKQYKKIAALDDHNSQYLHALAVMHHKMGQYDETEPLYLEALATRIKQVGGEHPSVAACLNNLASLYRSQGRNGEAEPLYLEALAICKKQLKDERPMVASSLNNLAALYNSQGRYDEAEPLYVESLVIIKKQLGDEHPIVAISLNNLATLYYSQGRYGEAEPLYKESLAIRQIQLRDEHPMVASSLNNLATLYNSQGRYGEAEPLYLEALAIRKKQLGDEHPDVASTLNNLAGLYESQGRYGEAELLYLEAIGILEKSVGVEHPITKAAKGSYEYLLKQKNNDKGS